MSFQLSQLLVGIISEFPAIHGPAWLCLTLILSLRQTAARHLEKPTLSLVIPYPNINFSKADRSKSHRTYSQTIEESTPLRISKGP